jgi:hypothetical protein
MLIPLNPRPTGVYESAKNALARPRSKAMARPCACFFSPFELDSRLIFYVADNNASKMKAVAQNFLDGLSEGFRPRFSTLRLPPARLPPPPPPPRI